MCEKTAFYFAITVCEGITQGNKGIRAIKKPGNYLRAVLRDSIKSD